MKLEPLSMFSKETAQISHLLWSGREDSNLRPLPPEGGSPRRIWLKSYVCQRTFKAFSAQVAGLFTGLGSWRALSPCLSTAPAGVA